ncbi:deoxyribose-phosphate aldolase [Marinigracilibium pacificum]|uniref:Deoxyribose-phosphate aldolase n=1 Tax=Marinigracilibium pacificum TaxID=2729599 RepID=A0A848J316_9BACT|nr:deoxyribose-phosphate aldolase [Marinigracilibium pacificum]NMM49728.1 deoxyribose-phosphate aldolase [Marinigracilibium pacificum]
MDIKINRYIEHTRLSPTFTDNDVYALVEEAAEHNFLGICLPPFWVKKAKREIGDQDIQLVSVAGFPLGYNMTETKIEEIKKMIDDGVDEIDLVFNISAFKAGMIWPKIEVAKCATLAHDNYKIIKVIIETAYLNGDEIQTVSKLCADAGVDFVKTSTGFAPSGADVNDIRIMRETLPSNVGIKASGGISSLSQAQQMINAGADRIGTSKGLKIMEEFKSHSK